VQPNGESKIAGIRKWEGDYIPAIFNRKKIDEVMEVSAIEAKVMTQRLAEEEGIFAGMSSGGILASALKVAEKIDKGVIVAIVCDRGDRYLSSTLFNKE
jgi:cysteine synthase B